MLNFSNKPIQLALKGKTAVITGAASGIGKGFAIRCAQEGMNVVLADIEIEPLNEVAKQLEDKGAITLPIETDVSDMASVENLAKATFEQFGQANILFSNAGVSGPFGPVWEIPLDQFNWTLKVNLMGTVHLLRAFIPGILKQPSYHNHIIITSSHLGLTSEHSLSPYSSSKHALVSLAEATREDLKLQKIQNIGVSVFFPFFVQSELPNSGRHRKASDLFVAEDSKSLLDNLTTLTAQGITPSEAADCVFKGIANRDFYIFTDDRTKKAFLERASEVVGKEWLHSGE